MVFRTLCDLNPSWLDVALTNDRMAATGWTEYTQLCRFCKQTKQSMPHLTAECDSLHQEIGVHQLPHQLGENFMMLGHVEHPFFHRAQAAAAPEV